MLQRTLLRSSRAANVSLSPRTPFRQLNLQTPSPFLKAQTQLPRIGARWYSEATEPAKDKASESQSGSSAEGDGKGAAAPAAEADKLKKELEEKKKEVIDMKDKYLRSVADFRNLQERTKREVSSARDFAISRFARDLIESIDNLDRALTTVPADAIAAEAAEGESPAQRDLRNLHDGLKMTETILMQTLKKHGLERVDPAAAGDKFDPNMHEAVFQTPQEGKEDGTVIFTQQKGFVLNGRVIRAPKVGIVKNS